MTSQRQIDAYTEIFRRVMDQLHKRAPCAERLHIFYAGPVALAVNLGRFIYPTVDPRVMVYNYRFEDRPRYSWGFDINLSSA